VFAEQPCSHLKHEPCRLSTGRLTTNGLCDDVSFLQHLGLVSLSVRHFARHIDQVQSLFLLATSIATNISDAKGIAAYCAFLSSTDYQHKAESKSNGNNIKINVPTIFPTVKTQFVPSLIFSPPVAYSNNQFKHAFNTFTRKSVCFLHGKFSSPEAAADLYSIVIDTGCSVSLTFCKEDFIELQSTRGSIATANGHQKLQDTD
jgi:hypothetical protein